MQQNNAFKNVMLLEYLLPASVRRPRSLGNVILFKIRKA